MFMFMFMLMLELSWVEHELIFNSISCDLLDTVPMKLEASSR